MGSPVAGLEGTSEGEALDNGIVLEKFLVLYNGNWFYTH